MIDPVAKSIQALYPAPNLPGTVSNGITTNNFATVLPNRTTVQKYFGRIDADVRQSNRITGSAVHNENNTPGLSPVCPSNCISNITSNTDNQLSDVWTINPTTINEARIGFHGEYDYQVPNSIGQGWPAKLGLKYGKTDAFPSISISGMYGFGPGTNFIDKENLFDLSDTVTFIRGRHVLHAGGEAIIERVDSTIWGGINSASLSFNGAYTSGSNDKASPLTSTTGTPYADFLLGYSRSWSAGSRPEYAGRKKGAAAFIQDDWKLTPKLTVNIGVRWEGRTGWYDDKNNVRSFDPTIINPATKAPGAMWYATTHVNGRTALEASKFNNWLPRIGVAYQLGSKMTVRSGFGLYSFPWSAVYSNGVGAAFGSSGNQTDSTNNVAPVVLLSSDGNTNYQGAKGAAINSLYKAAPTEPDSYNGQGVNFAQYDQPIPTLKEWNLDVARQITGNSVVEVAYVGSRGTNLAFVTDLNQVPQSRLSPNDAQFRPYPQFQSITGVSPQGYSNYNALEATVARRMSNGLEFNFNYTWSHMLSNQDSSGWNSLQGNQPYQNAYDPAANYGASNFDIRNMFKGQAIYELPFGRGRRFLNSNAALNQVIGGWTVSGTWMSQGGNPFTPYMLVNNSYALSSNMSWYPNQVGNPKLAHPSINGWFNTAAYAAPAPGTFGNMRRNSVYGPGMQDMNMSLHKKFPIHERVAFDFSANATNVLNHPSFGQPDAAIGPGHNALIRSVTVGGRSMELIGKISF